MKRAFISKSQLRPAKLKTKQKYETNYMQSHMQVIHLSERLYTFIKIYTAKKIRQAHQIRRKKRLLFKF